MTLLARKPTTGRYDGMFVGNDAGAWEYWPAIHLGRQKMGWTWEAVLGMSRKNEGRNLSMEGATEHHPGFLRALSEMAAVYPELNDFVLDFDGKQVAVPGLLRGGSQPERIDWKSVTFYHGTSSAVVPSILERGLRPRGVSGRAVYGTTAGAAKGRSDAVYLTTQPGTAHFAAIEAAKMLGGKPTTLAVRGLSGDNMAPDEDSHEHTAEASLARLGSVAHIGRIAPSHIRVHGAIGDDGGWHEVAGGGKRRHGKQRSILALAEDVRRSLR
jgi:hypothetical protein